MNQETKLIKIDRLIEWLKKGNWRIVKSCKGGERGIERKIRGGTFGTGDTPMKNLPIVNCLTKYWKSQTDYVELPKVGVLNCETAGSE